VESETASFYYVEDEKGIMEILFTSILAFASTNIDDIIILTLFFGDKRYKPADIYIGQYLGIIVLIGVSVTGSLIGNFIDDKYIGLLGFFPIYLGVRQIISLVNGGHEDEKVTQKGDTDSTTGVLSVAAVTIANGGDNIGTYVPLFAPLTLLDKSIMIVVFLVLVFIWLTTARYSTTHPFMVKTILKYGHIITPVVLCLLGIFILKENGSFSLLK
jgi:cadmium resistance transport/sequestration family protein